jgi:hypothetical protein
MHPVMPESVSLPTGVEDVPVVNSKRPRTCFVRDASGRQRSGMGLPLIMQLAQ